MPKISIITPCYNAEAHLVDTLRSVEFQNYRDFEHIVVDGASTDNSMNVIENMQNERLHVICERDEGQYDAVNKGIAQARGEILCWLNAGDVYFPWTLSVVARVFATFKSVHWIIGQYGYLNEVGELTHVAGETRAFPRHFVKNGWFRRELGGYLQQESMFWSRSLWEQAGGLRVDLSLAGDFELWTRFAEHAELVAVRCPLAAFRIDKTAQRSKVFEKEYERQVQSVVVEKPRPPFVWEMIAKRGLIYRNLARLGIYTSSPCILYDKESERWALVDAWRSIAGESLGTLRLMRAARRKIRRERVDSMGRKDEDGRGE